MATMTAKSFNAEMAAKRAARNAKNNPESPEIHIETPSISIPATADLMKGLGLQDAVTISITGKVGALQSNRWDADIKIDLDTVTVEKKAAKNEFELAAEEDD